MQDPLGMPAAPPKGSPRARLALRFISGKYQGGEFPIDENHPIVVGRSSDLDMVLVEEMVSRKHAKIELREGKIHIEDLGSTNGTFVDGARIVEPTLLGGGAEIKVGTTVLVVEGVLPVSDSTGDIAPRNVTRVSRAITEEAPPPAAAATAAPAAAAPAAPAAPLQVVGEFRPPERSRKQPGLASRSWVPVALSFGTVIIVAIALVIYFSQHT